MAALFVIAFATWGCDGDTPAADVGTDAAQPEIQGGDASALSDVDVPDTASEDASDAADATDATDAADATDLYATLAECAERYVGFDTCCAFDAASGMWAFTEAPCTGATECALAVDCPAGFVEMASAGGECRCESPLAGTCKEEPPLYVFYDAPCPVDRSPNVPPRTTRCALTWPPGFNFACTQCSCETRPGFIALRDPPDCRPGEVREDCPCTPPQKECCVDNTGTGLSCGHDRWERFYDGPCVPTSTDPFPGFCP